MFCIWHNILFCVPNSINVLRNAEVNISVGSPSALQTFSETSGHKWSKLKIQSLPVMNTLGKVFYPATLQLHLQVGQQKRIRSVKRFSAREPLCTTCMSGF